MKNFTSNNSAIICIVDKSFGASHSFVDGMLCRELSEIYNCVVVYFFQSNALVPDSLLNNLVSVESPVRRNLFGRMIQGPYVFFKEYSSFRSKKINMAVFVRNELFVLLFFSLLKFFGCKYQLIYQHSHPHEESIRNTRLRSVYDFLLLLALKSVDKVFVVSELAVNRMRSYCPTKKIDVIPLCTDFPVASHVLSRTGPIRFVYVGTFSRVRRLDVVVSSINSIKEMGGFEFHIYGGDVSDFLDEYPMLQVIVGALVSSGYLYFHGKVHRSALLDVLSSFDVGVNLIPPIDIYLDSSSTKLGEYLSQGLPALSSVGIKYHHDVHARADVGWMCDFDEVSIGSCVTHIVSGGRSGIDFKRSSCIDFAVDHLSYKLYSHLFVCNNSPLY